MSLKIYIFINFVLFFVLSETQAPTVQVAPLLQRNYSILQDKKYGNVAHKSASLHLLLKWELKGFEPCVRPERWQPRPRPG
jgi:hypothetical protein